MNAMISSICLSLMLACTVSAAVYTVDDDGVSDFDSISACLNAVDGGDTCLVRTGSYSGFTWSNSGAPGTWVKVVGAAGHAPVVNGPIRLDDVDYIHIEGLGLQSVSTASYTGPKCNHVKIINNAFTGPGGARIALSIRGDDVLISGNTFEHFGNDIIRQFGVRWVIRNNTVIAETEYAPEHMDFWQTFCGGEAPDELVGSLGLIENNAWIDVVGGHVHFVLGNATAGCNMPITNMIVRHNLVARSGARLIVFDTNRQAQGTSHNVIYNNTFYQLHYGGTIPDWLDYISMSGSTDSSGINNIFYRALDYGRTRGFLWASGGAQSYNLYFDPDHTMTFRSPASTETGAVKNHDPLFSNPGNNDFSLDENSRARDAGGPLTFVAAGDTGVGAALVVEQPEFFQPGWAGANADRIAVGDVNNVTQVVSIDYNTHTLHLSIPLERSDGDPIWLYADSSGKRILYGAAPDIGAAEYGCACTLDKDEDCDVDGRDLHEVIMNDPNVDVDRFSFEYGRIRCQ